MSNSHKNTPAPYHNNLIDLFCNSALLKIKGRTDNAFQKRGVDCRCKHKDHVPDLLNFATFFMGTCSVRKTNHIKSVNITTCSRFLRPGRCTSRCCGQEQPTWFVAELDDGGTRDDGGVYCISIGQLRTGRPSCWQPVRWSELAEQRRSLRRRKDVKFFRLIIPRWK